MDYPKFARRFREIQLSAAVAVLPEAQANNRVARPIMGSGALKYISEITSLVMFRAFF
jgi:hypothetical protein